MEYNPNGSVRTWVTIRVPLGPIRDGAEALGRVDMHITGPRATALKRIKAAVCYSELRPDGEAINFLLDEVAKETSKRQNAETAK